MKTFAEYLAENLIDVDKSDIDKIYTPLKSVMKDLTAVWDRNFKRLQAAQDTVTRIAISRTFSREFKEAISNAGGGINQPLKIIKSSELKSENAKIAHAANPIEIWVWLVHKSNQYSPQDKRIHICLPDSVYFSMVDSGVHQVPANLLPSLRSEVSELKYKATIRHELTHWMDDSLHNFHLSKGINTAISHLRAGNSKAAQQTYKRMVLGKENDIYMTHIEITPMVNQIAEYKRRVSKKQWDSMTWTDLVVALPSLGGLNYMHGEAWRKKMFDRLSRENLLGPNFRKSVAGP